MAANVNELIVQVRQLPRRQRLVLLAALSHSLLEEQAPEVDESEFWEPNLLSELDREQGTGVFSDWRHFVAEDVWPEDESLEEFEQFQQHERLLEIQRAHALDEAQ